MICNKALLVVATTLIAVNAHAGFFLVDGEPKGKEAPASVEKATEAPSVKKHMTGKFVVFPCSEGCGSAAKVAKNVNEIELRVGKSLKASDLATIRDMPSIVILCDGTLAAKKKAASIKNLLSNERVVIKDKGADAGSLLIREGE